MKRLVTFIALLTCFLGAKAEWVVDYRIDYNNYSGFPFYVMGYVPEWIDGVMTDYGAMYGYVTDAEIAEARANEEAWIENIDKRLGTVTTVDGTVYNRLLWKEAQWHQYFIADNIPTAYGGNYVVRAMVRASEPCEINSQMCWSWTDGGQNITQVSIPATDDFVEVEWTHSGILGPSCFLVAQPGTSTATIEWQYVIVEHDTDAQPPLLELVEDYKIDYQDYSGFPFWVMGYVPEWYDGVMTDMGGKYTYEAVEGAEHTSDVVVKTDDGTEYYRLPSDNTWHQYFIADWIPTEIGGKYKVKALVKASEACSFNVMMEWGWDNDDQRVNATVNVGTDWQEVEWEYSNIGGTSCGLIAQPDTEAQIEWKWLTVSHTRPYKWVEQLTKGNAEKGWTKKEKNIRFDDTENNYKICAWAKEKDVNVNDEGGWDPFPATIEQEKNGNHYFVVHGKAATTEGDASAWDNQFWIQSPKSWKTGQMVKIHFRYKASKKVLASTQVHKQNPSDYLMWHAIGDIAFTTKWQEFDGIMFIEDDMDGTWSIAFQLNQNDKDAIDFYFDDLSWKALEPIDISDTWIKLNKSEVAIEKGKTLTLKAKVNPTTLQDPSVTWESSDPKIVNVTSTGKIKGLKVGKATITCTSNATGLKATCEVTVGYVKLSDTELTIEKDKTKTLTAKVYPTTEDQGVTWKSSNTEIATVTSKGKVKGLKAGTVYITCTSKATGLSAVCEVTVGYVKLNKTEVSIEKGKTLALKAKVYPTTLDQTVTWKSSNSNIVKVTSAGKIKGLKAGTATITCVSNATGLTATCKVTVTKASAAPSLDDVTGIEEKAALAEEFDVYDLNGRKVLNKVTSLDGLSDGIYIVNGKKIVVKK